MSFVYRDPNFFPTKRLHDKGKQAHSSVCMHNNLLIQHISLHYLIGRGCHIIGTCCQRSIAEQLLIVSCAMGLVDAQWWDALSIIRLVHCLIAVDLFKLRNKVRVWFTSPFAAWGRLVAPDRNGSNVWQLERVK
jgi:hypothetical protein